MLALFAFIMTGIYGGLFQPPERPGGARRQSWRSPVSAAGWIAPASGGLVDTTIAPGMIFGIIIGAEIFGNFVTVAGLTQGLSDLVAGLGLGPWTVMLCIVVIYLLLGCVPESLSMILLTVPVFFPVVAGMDCGTETLGSHETTLIWFAVVVVVAMEIGLITPRAGMNVFVLGSVVLDVPLATIFRGVFSFWDADMLRLALIVGVPGISLWLVT